MTHLQAAAVTQARSQEQAAFLRIPELKHVEVRFSRYRRQVFKKHTHDTYSIGMIHNGSSEAYLHDRLVTLRSGDLVFIPPGEVHACNPGGGTGLTYHMFYVEEPLMEALSRALFGRPEPGIACREVHVPGLRQEFAALYRLMARPGDLLEKQSQLYHTLGAALLACLPGQAVLPSPAGGEQVLAGAYRFLMEHLYENVSLEELAGLAHMSPYHFLRTFREVYGLPPHAYRLQKRVSAARRLLAQGHPVAQVACETGFSDQSHFTRHFKSLVGVTPRQYADGGSPQNE
ncbi:MAG: AraC family transcriptional regulator [Chloroflexi bacterium]|nr:AraC family transcriptional regulator [Chloroflexota bacterium]